MIITHILSSIHPLRITVEPAPVTVCLCGFGFRLRMHIRRVICSYKDPNEFGRFFFSSLLHQLQDTIYCKFRCNDTHVYYVLCRYSQVAIDFGRKVYPPIIFSFPDIH